MGKETGVVESSSAWFGGRLHAILSSSQEGRHCTPFCSRLRHAGKQCPCKDELWALQAMCTSFAPCQPLQLLRRATALVLAATPLQLLRQGQDILPIIISLFAFLPDVAATRVTVLQICIRRSFADDASAVWLDPHAKLWMHNADA